MRSKSSNIVHQYFKKELDGLKIIVKVNPIQWKGTELTVMPDGKVESRDLEFDEAIFEDLKEDGFETASPLEFNLYQTGLA
ncbi:MAG TPA: hypothetical protein VG737_16655 [Cyclobacteriaceae bacterium]|nr:hypothetical protein [Cyclobacteriaceae bacterium]